MTRVAEPATVAFMLSRLLAILAVAALLVSPMNAVAAQMACDEMAMSATAPLAADMVAMPDGATDPCCDPHKAPTKSPEGCLQACLVMGGMAAALPSPAPVVAFAWVRFEPVVDRPLRPPSRAPPTVKRPPRSIA